MKIITKPKVYLYPTRYRYDIVKNIFCLDESIIKYLQADIISHRVEVKSDMLSKRIEERISKISIDYDNKVNKMLDRLIINNDLEKYSIENLNRLVTSVMRVTKSLSSSLTSIVIGLEDIK